MVGGGGGTADTDRIPGADVGEGGDVEDAPQTTTTSPGVEEGVGRRKVMGKVGGGWGGGREEMVPSQTPDRHRPRPRL